MAGLTDRLKERWAESKERREESRRRSEWERGEREASKLRKLREKRIGLEGKARIASREIEERKGIAKAEKTLGERKKLRYEQSPMHKIGRTLDHVEKSQKRGRGGAIFDPIGDVGFGFSQPAPKRRKRRTTKRRRRRRKPQRRRRSQPDPFKFDFGI